MTSDLILFFLGLISLSFITAFSGLVHFVGNHVRSKSSTCGSGTLLWNHFVGEHKLRLVGSAY